MIDCTGPHLKKHSVKVRDVPETAKHERKIIKFDQFPRDPNSYFDLKTQNIVYNGREREIANETNANNNTATDNKNDAKENTYKNTNTSINETINFTQDETLMTVDFANIICAGRSEKKISAHGDMTMIGSDGHYLLIDTSEDFLRKSVIKFLDDKNYADKEFDILISHNHEDHWGNAEYLMKNYKIGTLYLPEGKEFKYASLERLAKSKGIKVKRLKQGDWFNIGKAKLEVLYNPHNKVKYYNDESATNNKSLVTRISVQTVSGKEIRYLTCGDIQEGLEKELLKEGIDVRADIFKFSHHCMETSNTEEFIDAIQPKFTVSNWWQDKSTLHDSMNQFPRTESTQRVIRAGKYGIVYSVIYNNGVKFSVSAHGVITPEIYDNIEKIPYVIKDNQGNVISTYNFQIPIDAKVKEYQPKKEMNVEQIQAIQSQIKDHKIVGEMVANNNTSNIIAQENRPIKVLFVGNSFTYYNDCAGIFAELAKKQNREVIAVCATRAVWGADELLGLKKDEKGDKIATYYWDNRGNETKLHLNGKKALDYNIDFDSIISTDWGNLGRANSWDYVVLQNHNNAKENDHVYEKVKDMIGNPGNLIVLRTWGVRSSDNMKENADKNGYSWIDVNNIAKNDFQGNWKEELSQQDDRLHPSSEGAYLTATMAYATIFGKEELAHTKDDTHFIQLYNQDGQRLKDVIKEAVQHASGTKDANDVTEQEAKAIQALVYQNFDKNIKSRVTAQNTTKQIQNIPDGAVVINIDANFSNGYVSGQNLNTTGENMVKPRSIDIPDKLTRIIQQVMGREYSMVIPMPNTQGIICDEYGSYEDPNQLYTLSPEKMYPAFYAINFKFDAAEKNCRVIKDEIVDENGSIKEIYALVKNESLLKTVRIARVVNNTKLTAQNGTSYNVPAGRDILIVGNTAIVSELTLDGKDIAGIIPSSNYVVYNDKWKEVLTGATKDLHIYYDNKTNQYVWGYKSGRKKMTIYSPENITKKDKKCIGTEVKEQTPGELESRFILIGKLGEKDKKNQNEIEK